MRSWNEEGNARHNARRRKRDAQNWEKTEKEGAAWLVVAYAK